MDSSSPSDHVEATGPIALEYTQAAADSASPAQETEMCGIALSDVDHVGDVDGVGYQFVPVLTPSSDTHSRHRQSPPSDLVLRDVTESPIHETVEPDRADAHAADGNPLSSLLCNDRAGYECKGALDEDAVDDAHEESSIHRSFDSNMDLSSASPAHRNAATPPTALMVGQHLLRCVHATAAAGQHISALVLSSCGLHDEDIASSLCAAHVLPHLFSLDLSDNLLQTFPTFVLRRMTGTVTTSSAATTKPTSPWAWNVSRNHRMRLFPPMVLECEVMGSIVLTGCLQLMPNVVVAGLKGLVCGEVYLPEHTDETAVFESMLGLLAVNGRHVHKRRGVVGGSAALGPQHARKCEGHLQNLRRRYLPPSPSTTHFLPQLLEAVRLQVDLRHVDHPRLLQRHLRLVEHAQESYVMQQLATLHRLWASATEQFDAPPPPPYSTDDDGDVFPEDIALRYSIAPPPTTTLNVMAQRPLSFPTWKRLLFFADGSDGKDLPFFDAAVCAMVGCSVFPEVFPRCLVLQFVDRVLEECLTQQTAEVRRHRGADDAAAVGLRSDILALCDTVGWWPVLVYDAFYAHLFGAAAAAQTTADADALLPKLQVMQSHHAGGSLAGHWTARRLTSPLDLPLERLLLAAQALRIGADGNSQPRHDSSHLEEEEVVADALHHFADILSQFHNNQEMNQTTAAVEAEAARRSVDCVDQQKYNRVRMLSRPASSMASLPKAYSEQHLSQHNRSKVSSSLHSASVVTTLSQGSERLPSQPATRGTHSSTVQSVEQDTLSMVYNGFLPMRVPSTSIGGTEVSVLGAASLQHLQDRSAGGGGAYRLLDPRTTEGDNPPLAAATAAVRLAQRHLRKSGMGKSAPAPLRVQDQHASFDCLRPSTPATAVSTMQDTPSPLVTSAGTKGMPRAISAGGQYIGHLEARIAEAQQRATSSAAVGLEHQMPVSHPRRSRTLLDFLNRRGVLRLQSASAMRAINHASNLDLSDLHQVDQPPTLSSVAEGGRVVAQESRPSSSCSSSAMDRTAAPGRHASKGTSVMVSRVPSSATPPPATSSGNSMPPPPLDPPSVGCTLEEYTRAERLYSTTATQQHPSLLPSPHATSLQTILGMIYKLLDASHRQPGEVLRIFTSVVCEHALSEAVRIETQPPTWCEWICGDLEARGELRNDHSWVVDEVHMSSAFQLGKRSSTPGQRNLNNPLDFSSEIVHATLSSADLTSEAPLAAEPRGASREGRRHIPSGRPSSRLNDFAKNDSALDRDLVALSRAVSQPTVFVVAQPKAIRPAPSLPLAAVSAPQQAAAPQHLVDRGAHPFTVQAQQVLERERLRSHIRAASATPDDPYMTSAVKRSCSASLRPMRQPPPVASGRESTDWVATNAQFLPSVVRDHVTGARHPPR
jgi:hypothetical protein